LAEQLPLPLTLNPALDFDQFWPGPNAETVSHLRALANQSEEPLIFIWGDTGSGKTHLLNATCKRYTDAHKHALYLPLKEFRDFGPEALEGQTTHDLLCLDDVDGVASDAQWAHALFRLFNIIRDQGRQLLISASVPPESLDISLKDLKTRLGWGLTLKLKALEDEDKAQALILKAKALGLELPEGVAQYLLQQAQRDFGTLIGFIQHLDQASLAAQRKLTVPFVKMAMQEWASRG
jgi:DnaA family protein